MDIIPHNIVTLQTHNAEVNYNKQPYEVIRYPNGDFEVFSDDYMLEVRWSRPKDTSLHIGQKTLISSTKSIPDKANTWSGVQFDRLLTVTPPEKIKSKRTHKG